MSSRPILDQLGSIAAEVRDEFIEERRVLSFGEYLELFAKDPVRQARDASRYVRDMFDHYGRETVKRPWGELNRFRLFDAPWLGDAAQRDALIGQEEVQTEIYRALSNFVREGRPNRVVLLHGPSGSAKSTAARCIMRALEHYSTLDEGALYRFHWVFPSQRSLKGTIGFGDDKGLGEKVADESYAHLSDDEIDARLFIELRDHPLFLIPRSKRQRLLEHFYSEADADESPGEWIVGGRLCHKNRQVFENLLTTYAGSLDEVLRHVRVERYFISRRYRVGAVTVGPQLSVDAGERQLTADRSLAALPASLQSVTLFEAHGELVDAAGGVLEFSDLLKRPLDAFKYLQLTAETGEVQLTYQNLETNCVLLGSANEVQLTAFRAHPDFESFRGRLELVRAPYLRSYVDEQSIYDSQIVPQIRRHVAPHATLMAAMFAVLTRMRQPKSDRYEASLRTVLSELTAVEKMMLYATGQAPERLDGDSAKVLRGSVRALYRESEAYPIYEGSVGASPREMRTVLLDAAQDPRYDYLSPFAVLDELDALCERESEYAWLTEESLPTGYHDHEQFRLWLREHLLDQLEDEFRNASGLVEQSKYRELFDRYVANVSNWVKGEKVRNELTGEYEEPDERLMSEVEDSLGVADSEDTRKTHRHDLINAVAAWAIDNPGTELDNGAIFSSSIARLREAVFADRRTALAKLCRDVLVLAREDGAGLDDARRRAARAVLDGLVGSAGYIEASAVDAAAALVNERFASLLS